MLYQILIFSIAVIVTWASGVTLTKTTDSLDCRFRIGEDFGGLVLLGIAGSLPDIAVALSAAFHGHISVIIGNLLGGVAIQTLVIVIFDFVSKGKKPLSYLAGSATLSFEAIFAIIMVLIAMFAMFVPPHAAVYGMNPVSLLLPLVWLVGLYLINKAHKIKRFNQVEDDAEPGKLHDECRTSENSTFFVGKTNWYVLVVFLFSSLAIMIAGIMLEESGSAIAQSFGINSGIFAATAIALVTSLPEISTGTEAILIGDNHLAISDIWGGNSFMLVPFFVADLIVKGPVLSFAQLQDKIIAFLAIMMMSVYAVAFVKRPERQVFKLGFDSYLEIFLYLSGIGIMFYLKII